MSGNLGSTQRGDGRGNVPKKWPGEAGIKRAGPSLEPFLSAVFQMVEQCRVHVEVSPKSTAARDNWQSITERFFDPSSGMGRNFQFGSSNKRWSRFSKSIISAIEEYDRRHDQAVEGGRHPTTLMVLAHNLLTERQNAQESLMRARQAQAAQPQMSRQELED